MRQIKFLLGFAALAVMFFSCSKDPVGPDPPKDTTPPQVVKTIPLDSSTVDILNFLPTVIFSEPVHLGEQPPQLVSAIGPEEGTVDGTWILSQGRDSLFFNPLKPFTPGQMYKMLLTGIRDDAGNVMPDFTFCWFTAKKDTGGITIPDTTPPVVVSSFPADGATGVPVNTAVYNNFSEPLDPATITTESYKLVKADGTPVSVTVSYDPVNFQASMSHNGLDYETTYEVVLTSAITDTAGNHLVATSRSFTTENAPDITPPEVINSIPQDGATGVAVDITISDEFSEDLDPSTVNNSTYKLLKDGTQIPASVSYSNKTATLTPNAPLDYETTYEVVLTFDITDTAGNSFAGSTRVFTTEPEPVTPWVVENAYTIKTLDFDEQGNLFFAAEKYDYNGGSINTDAVLAGKFDPQGMLQWIKQLPSAVGLADVVFGISYVDGFVYILRLQSQGGLGFGNIYVDKLQAENGDLVWTHSYGNGGPFDIDVYGSYIYLATGDKVFQVNVSDGSIVTSITFDLNRSVVANENGVYVGSGNYTMYLKAYDYNLNEIWSRSYDTPLIETGGWVATYGNYVYMAGSSGDAIHGIPIDPVILKYDLQGNLQWDSTYTGIHPPGNDFRRFITCDPNTGEIYMVSGPVKFSPEGEKLWQNNIEGHYAVYRDGVLYVADNVPGNNKILRFNVQTGDLIQ